MCVILNFITGNPTYMHVKSIIRKHELYSIILIIIIYSSIHGILELNARALFSNTANGIGTGS